MPDAMAAAALAGGEILRAYHCGALSTWIPSASHMAQTYFNSEPVLNVEISV